MAKVLVIEDNAANMKLASLLRNAHHSVLCALDAEAGLMVAMIDSLLCAGNAT